ncbi:MAG: hypothetical protein KF718_32645 [Polyangiaceae bacterium]|nr:hypothetical protein [Polyangiaceae bacterium]
MNHARPPSSRRVPEYSHPDFDGVLCALVLAPPTFSRNRFFDLFQSPEGHRVRRRAARVRGLIRHLLGEGRARGEITGEQVLGDGQVILRLCVPELSFERTTALSELEASILRYALHRAGHGALAQEDRDRVERALERLGPDLGQGAGRD